MFDRDPFRLDNFQDHPGDNDGLTNFMNTIGAFRVGYFGDNASFESVSAVETAHLLEWARLVRYCHPTARTPVQAGYVEPDDGPDGLVLLAAKIPGEDRVVTVAPRTDGDTDA